MVLPADNWMDSPTCACARVRAKHASMAAPRIERLALFKTDLLLEALSAKVSKRPAFFSRLFSRRSHRRPSRYRRPKTPPPGGVTASAQTMPTSLRHQLARHRQIDRLLGGFAGRGSSSRRRIKIVIGGVAALYFNVLLGGIAVGCEGRQPGMGVNALNAGDTAEHAISGMTSGGHQEPRN
jgi:hypothetical protein